MDDIRQNFYPFRCSDYTRTTGIWQTVWLEHMPVSYIKNLLLLLMEQEATVSSLADRLGMTPSAVSHRLGLLKSNKLARRRKDGKTIYYTLSDDHIRLVMKKGIEHILER